MLLSKDEKRRIHAFKKSKIKKNGDPKQIFTTVVFEKNKRESGKGQTPWGFGNLTWNSINNYKNLKLPRLLHDGIESGYEKACQVCKKHINYSDSVCVECQREVSGEPISNPHTDYAHDYWKSNNCPNYNSEFFV